MKIKYFAALVLVFFVSNCAFGALNDTRSIGYGARPMGMGGAYTALANDANAAYWNPAGFALNPGLDITGSMVATNRNQSIGDNIGALKVCFETEVNPFAWVLGLGLAASVAFDATKYLANNGIIKKNWGRSEETTKKEESVAEKVLEKGTEKTEAVVKKFKQEAKTSAKEALKNTMGAIKSLGKEIIKDEITDHEKERIRARQAYVISRGTYISPWYDGNPYYHYNSSRRTYWDNGIKDSEGKAEFAGGITWVTDKNPPLNQNTNFYSFSLATGYQQFVALGGNVNLYDITIPNPSNTKGYGAGLDLGLILKPVDQLAFGATVKEILTTDVKFDNGAMIRYPMSINCGVAIVPVPELTISGDVHNLFKQGSLPQTYHFGAEARPVAGIAVRAGLYDQSKTAGLSLMVNQIIIDYTYLGGAFDKTQLVGLTWKI
ncbi:hypothetical protein HZC34_00220 [Candidatus Saganbacteria bacterium]|nr:hypothetical protein [Candidatus Saganbacteria bacterium]